jgi:transcriptional regulator GlxA family with amidase domain
VPLDDHRSWSERFARLEAEFHDAAPAGAQAADALLKLLIIDATRLAFRAPSAQPTQVVTDAAAVIDQRFRGPLSLADVAAAVSVSPSHLTRLVRQAMGRSVGELIRDRRMEEARHLLSDSETPVDAIAARVGYRDVTHFRRHFARVHETTPARWRERARPELAGRVR